MYIWRFLRHYAAGLDKCALAKFKICTCLYVNMHNINLNEMQRLDQRRFTNVSYDSGKTFGTSSRPKNTDHSRAGENIT